MQVEPENRLVATTLEAEWNTKLKELAKAQEEYEQKRQQDLRILKKEDREKILSLATDFPRLWQNPNVPYKEKKRIIRLLIDYESVLALHTARTGRTAFVVRNEARCRGATGPGRWPPAPP